MLPLGLAIHQCPSNLTSGSLLSAARGSKECRAKQEKSAGLQVIRSTLAGVSCCLHEKLSGWNLAELFRPYDHGHDCPQLFVFFENFVLCGGGLILPMNPDFFRSRVCKNAARSLNLFRCSMRDK